MERDGESGKGGVARALIEDWLWSPPKLSPAAAQRGVKNEK